MARFEFFDSYATQSGSLTSYSSESESRPFNLCEECGDEGSETRFETVGQIINRTVHYALNFLSASESVSFSTSVIELPGSDQPAPFAATASSTRNAATNPTYTTGVGTDTGTESGGYTFRTTGTTTQLVSLRETTTAETSAGSPLFGAFGFGNYLNTSQTQLAFSPGGSAFSAPFSFGSVIESTGITLTVSTTVTGYAFCQVVRNAAFLYTLDPRRPGEGSSNERFSPAYWVTTPLSEGLSFSATNTTGTHRVFDISSVESTGSSSASSEWELLCLANITETWTELYDPGCPLDASSFTESLFTHYGSYASSTQTAGTQAVWKTYATAGEGPTNRYIRKSPAVGFLYIDPGAEPSTAVLYESFSASPEYATGDTSNLGSVEGVGLVPQGFASVSVSNYVQVDTVANVFYGKVISPLWFTGAVRGAIRSGSSAVPATFAWSGLSSLFYTTGSGTNTASAQVTFNKTTAASSAFSTESQKMDVLFPPWLRRTGTEFEPTASYGLAAGTYKLASTNSTGGVSSETSSGIVSTTVPSSAYGRPQRKIAYSYATTTQSGYGSGFRLTLGSGSPGLYYFSIANLEMPVFTSLYGGIAGVGPDGPYQISSGQALSSYRYLVSVEESRGNNNAERTLA